VRYNQTSKQAEKLYELTAIRVSCAGPYGNRVTVVFAVGYIICIISDNAAHMWSVTVHLGSVSRQLVLIVEHRCLSTPVYLRSDSFRQDVAALHVCVPGGIYSKQAGDHCSVRDSADTTINVSMRL